jgi:hypothetical protein
MNQPCARYRNKDRFSRAEPGCLNCRHRSPALMPTALADTFVSGAGGWLEKIIPNKLERR